MQIAFDLKKAYFGVEKFRIGVIHKKVAPALKQSAEGITP